MSRAVDRDRPMPEDSPPEPGPLWLSSIVMRARDPSAHALPPRPPPGRRAGRGHRHPALPARPARRGPRRREPRARLRRDRLLLPRDLAVPARGARPRGAGRLRRAPHGPRTGRDRAAARGGARAGARARGPGGRRLDRRPQLELVARPAPGRGVRGARVLRRPVAVRPCAPPARRRVRRGAARLRRGRGGRRRRRQHPVPAARRARPRRARVAADRQPPPRRREVRRAADPALDGRLRDAHGRAGRRLDPLTVPPKKLVLAVVDAMKPAMLEQAVAEGRAPTLALLMERGHHVDECVAAFPSVTPVCAASIATGTTPDRHLIPSMNWYHREEGRYVEYGTSFRASQAFGFKRSLTDTIYNMNGEHLSRATPTVFETLDDAGVRTAGTTYLMYRGRHRHEPANETALTRIASTVFRDPVYGPREFFYADLFASPRPGCRPQLALPGIRAQHGGCVGAYLVEEDLFDFLLLPRPDNDPPPHRHGPDGQVTSLAAADRQLERVMHA